TVLKYFFSLIFICNSLFSSAQVVNQSYTFDQSQKYNNILYNTNSRYHTASKPFLFKNEMLNRKDSLENVNQTLSSNWIMRKLFNEHLVDVQKEDHTFYLDFLPDFQIGSELIDSDKRTTWTNTRAIQAGLTIKDKFTFHTAVFENQAVFAEY